MSVTIKELTADHGADNRWFTRAYHRWLQELAGDQPLPAAESELQLRALLAARERRVFLIHRESHLTGFAVVGFSALAARQTGGGAQLTPDYQLIDFFVDAEGRRLGVGSEAVRLLLLRFRGVWEVSELEGDHDAIRFWRKVIGRLTNGTFSEQRRAGRWHQHFQS